MGGWNPDASPWEMVNTQAPVLDNMLFRPGKVVMRGGLLNWADLSGQTPPWYPIGVVQPPNSNQLFFGRKTLNATNYIDHAFVPIVRPAAATNLAVASANLYQVVGGTTVTVTAVGTANVPSWRSAFFNGNTYYIAGDTTAAAVQDDNNIYFIKPVPINVLAPGGTTGALGFAPQGALDIKVYQSRLWLLGGCDTPASLTKFNALKLFFTNPGASNSLGTQQADWQDPVAGTTNFIHIDGNYMDPGVGLGLTRNAMVIFRYSSVYRLSGTTTASYTISPVSREVGCVDARSILESDHGIYFVSKRGLMLTDGITVKNLSGPVLHTLQSAIGLVMTSIKSGIGGWVTTATTSLGHIVVSLGVNGQNAGAPTGHQQPVWCGMYDPVGNAWTRITSSLFANDGTITVTGNNYPGPVMNTMDKRLVSVGDQAVTQWEAEVASTTLSNFGLQNYPSAAADSAAIGTIPWSNPANIESADGVYATATGSGTTHYLQGTFPTNFAVPSVATITGISVSVVRLASNNTSVQDTNVQLMKAGVVQATNRSAGAPWSTSSTAATFGSSTDLWGTTWTPADVNNSGFGLAIAASIGGGATASVDAFLVSVFYTIAGSVQQQSFVQQPGLYDKDKSGNYQPIPAVWQTRYVPVIGTTTLARKFGQIKRWFLDYMFQGNGLPSANGWTITPQDATGTIVSGAQTVVTPPVNVTMVPSSVSGGPPAASTTIQRINVDMQSEIDDLHFTVTFTDTQQASQPVAVAPEIYGIGIEFQPTHDKR